MCRPQPAILSVILRVHNVGDINTSVTVLAFMVLRLSWTVLEISKIEECEDQRKSARSDQSIS